MDELIHKIKEIMIDVSTGKARIEETNQSQMSDNDSRLQDVLRSVLAEQNVPQAEHRAELASTERSL